MVYTFFRRPEMKGIFFFISLARFSCYALAFDRKCSVSLLFPRIKVIEPPYFRSINGASFSSSIPPLPIRPLWFFVAFIPVGRFVVHTVHRPSRY